MDTLTKILTVATELFRQYGFKTITMDDIARRAGISKKTLYQHFANKGEVVHESVVWFKTGITKSCFKKMEEAGNAVEGMVQVMTVLDQLHREMNPLLLFELERFYPETFRHFKESLMAEDVEAIRNNICSGIEAGLYRAALNPEFIARYRMELSLIVFYPSMLVNNSLSLSSVSYAISEHFLYGIMTEKGIALYTKHKAQYLQKVTEI